MCIVISHLVVDHPTIATEDIIVYKSGSKPEKLPEVFSARFFTFYYEKNKLYKTQFKTTIDESWFDPIEETYRDSLKYPVYISHGFHALTELDMNRLNSMGGIHKIGMFIIPKGAHYYETPAKCIVSDKIIFKEFI